MLPLTIYTIWMGETLYPMLYIANLITHFYVDDLKANKKKINLIQDQCVHMIQILGTWILYFWIY